MANGTQKNGSKVIKVTDPAYQRVGEIVASLRARGLSVTQKSVMSEMIMLCPIPQPQPKRVEKRRRRSSDVQSTAAAV